MKSYATRAVPLAMPVPRSGGLEAASGMVALTVGFPVRAQGGSHIMGGPQASMQCFMYGEVGHYMHTKISQLGDQT